ncbi:MAG: MGMT family protein [Candidatus Delongbacteria bacterium]|nr:MGMT family protein [Candidatus Delongbacteria bacterium]
MKKLKLPSQNIVIDSVETAFGWISFAISSKGLKESRFMFETKESAEEEISKLFDPDNISSDKKISKEWSQIFKNYFDGKIKSLENIPLDSDSWSAFQKKVYFTVKSIPYGKTASYGTIASYLGNDNASRAVGNALKNNPIPPVIPCHRVIAADKDMCGFSALGGVELKLKLLELEKDNS